MNVWMGRHAHEGNITMLITRCPVAIKQGFMDKASEYFKRHLRYPMMIHLYFLRSIARNHWNTLRNRMQNLHEEVSLDANQITVSQDFTCLWLRVKFEH